MDDFLTRTVKDFLSPRGPISGIYFYAAQKYLELEIGPFGFSFLEVPAPVVARVGDEIVISTLGGLQYFQGPLGKTISRDSYFIFSIMRGDNKVARVESADLLLGRRLH